MDDVPVFQFVVFDILTGQNKISPRWATLDAIAAAKGVPMMETRKLVSKQELDGNGFHPPKQS